MVEGGTARLLTSRAERGSEVLDISGPLLYAGPMSNEIEKAKVWSVLGEDDEWHLGRSAPDTRSGWEYHDDEDVVLATDHDRIVRQVAALGIALAEYLEAQQEMPDDGYKPMIDALREIVE